MTTPQAPEATPGAVTPEEVTPPAPGSKTESELLLKSLQEERDKRRALEEENNKLKSSIIPDNEAFSDEGKMLQGKILSLESKLNSLEEEKALEKVCSQYPLLKEKISEFNEYRKSEHPRAKIESVAKLFLVENGLLETPQRIGLERSTGGSRSSVAPGMTPEDIENLRKNNYKLYKEKLMNGQLK